MSVDEARDPNITPGVVIPVDFKARRTDYVKTCTCDCQLFFLNVDGTIMCRACGQIMNLTWERRG